jgi:hypothetical protein
LRVQGSGFRVLIVTLTNRAALRHQSLCEKRNGGAPAPSNSQLSIALREEEAEAHQHHPQTESAHFSTSCNVSILPPRPHPRSLHFFFLFSPSSLPRASCARCCRPTCPLRHDLQIGVRRQTAGRFLGTGERLGLSPARRPDHLSEEIRVPSYTTRPGLVSFQSGSARGKRQGAGEWERHACAWKKNGPPSRTRAEAQMRPRPVLPPRARRGAPPRFWCRRH